MAHTYSPSFSGGLSERIAWTWEAEVEVSRDGAMALQPGWQSKTPSKKKKKKKNWNTFQAKQEIQPGLSFSFKKINKVPMELFIYEMQTLLINLSYLWQLKVNLEKKSNKNRSK